MPSARRSRPAPGRGRSPSRTTTPSDGGSANAASTRCRPSTWTPSAPRTSTMARRADRRFLLDTSAVIYQLQLLIRDRVLQRPDDFCKLAALDDASLDEV